MERLNRILTQEERDHLYTANLEFKASPKERQALFNELLNSIEKLKRNLILTSDDIKSEANFGLKDHKILENAMKHINQTWQNISQINKKTHMDSIPAEGPLREFSHELHSFDRNLHAHWTNLNRNDNLIRKIIYRTQAIEKHFSNIYKSLLALEQLMVKMKNNAFDDVKDFSYQISSVYCNLRSSINDIEELFKLKIDNSDIEGIIDSLIILITKLPKKELIKKTGIIFKTNYIEFKEEDAQKLREELADLREYFSKLSNLEAFKKLHDMDSKLKKDSIQTFESYKNILILLDNLLYMHFKGGRGLRQMIDDFKSKTNELLNTKIFSPI